ncbi:oligopeptide ABC transporter permease [uncultured Clostridium sp.]|uniref:oligopeptide ABC transporter permease n=1 Tax=uncultured Clostridium sp. TaxID=59620 RepID=UPI0025E0881C|nr:oligopeptide ABC transporter permease [uncultured Clostridium sp.]
MSNIAEKNIKMDFLADDFELAGESVSKVDRTYASQPYWKDVLNRFIKNKGAIIGIVFIALITLMAIVGVGMNDHTYDSQIIEHQNLAPRIPGLESMGIFDGSENNVNKYTDGSIQDGQSTYYWFGTDVLGRDIFTRTWMGTRISLYIALVAAIIDIIFGLSYGLISGYFGGVVDNVMQRFAEILNGIPSLVIVTLLIIVLKPGLITITFSLMITGWIGMSRIARAQMLKLKEQEFVLASKTLGAGSFHIIFKEILPNIFGQIITNTMFSIPHAIFTEAFLAFIGLGVPAPMASLGSLISDAFKSFTTHPYMIMPPIIVLAILMLSFNMVADGLRDAFDPRMKEM